MDTTPTLSARALLDGTHEAGTWSLRQLATALEADEAPAEAVGEALDALLVELGVTLHQVGIDPFDVLESLSNAIRDRTAGELDELDAAERGLTMGEALDYMVEHADWQAATVVTADAAPLAGERARASFGRSLLAFT